MSINTPIVIVEDDPDDQEIFKMTCEGLGVCEELKFFSEAKSALNYLLETSDKPFIIICDINIPRMSGLEFRRAINANDYLRRKSIPFIFFSTAANPQQVLDAYEMTVQGFFVKQKSLTETEEVLSAILKYWRNCIHPNSVRPKSYS